MISATYVDFEENRNFSENAFLSIFQCFPKPSIIWPKMVKIMIRGRKRALETLKNIFHTSDDDFWSLDQFLWNRKNRLFFQFFTLKVRWKWILKKFDRSLWSVSSVQESESSWKSLSVFCWVSLRKSRRLRSFDLAADDIGATQPMWKCKVLSQN